MPATHVHTQPRKAPGRPDASAVLLAALVVLSCTSYVLTGGGPRRADYQLRWALVLSDIALGLVAVAQLPVLREVWRDRSQHLCAVAAVGLGVSLLPALAANPSSRGVAALVRWVAVALVAVAVGRLTGDGRRLFVAVLATATTLQVLVAFAQRAGDGPLGLSRLGEAGPHVIGGRYASSGLTVHPYVFAAWCSLAAAVLVAAVVRSPAPPRMLRVAAVVPFAGVGLTQSRTGALAVASVLVALGMAAWHRPPLRSLLAGAVAAVALGGLLNLSGWINRASDSADGAADGQGVGSGRGQLIDQANGLFADHPVIGVGPGRYVEELVRRPDLVQRATEEPSRPVHLVPYLLLVEGGVVVLPALGLVGYAVATRSWRGGAVAVGLAAAVVPFLALDHLHWSYPQGLMLTGLWLGTLDQLGRPEPA